MASPAESGSRRTFGFWPAAAVILAIAAGFRALLLSRDLFPFNADEAVVGLMARHILRGEFPVFFYGQAYLGSLDALLVAAGFALAGPSVAVIRIVQSLVYLGTILMTMLLTREMRFSTGTSVIAGLLLAIPPVVVTLYTTVSLGGYGEALFLGVALLLLALRSTRGQSSWKTVAGWGTLAGFALWTFGLTLVFSIPAGLYLMRRAVRGLRSREVVGRLLALAGGVLLGALPMVIWGVSHGPLVLAQELLGSAIAGASPAGIPAALAAHAANLVLFGPTVVFGLRPPWDVVPLGMPLAPLAALVWIAAIGTGIRRSSWPSGDAPGRFLLAGSTLLVIAGFLLTGFGADPSGRYFLPLVPILAIAAAAGMTAWERRIRRGWVLLWLSAILAFNLLAHLQVAASSPRFTTQFDAETRYDHAYDDDLVAFLLSEGETAGYSTYWLAYPLAFLSDEQLVVLPHLPYHSDFRYTSRDDRYPPYREVVENSLRVAYVTARQAWLDQALRERLAEQGVGFEETVIGDFHVFHDLTRVVRPDELGLGANPQP